MSPAPPWDCLVIGGGPAGLSGALHLARFRDRTLVIDAGESRARLIPLTRNLPGFPEGVAGRQLLSLMRRQAEKYGAQFVEDCATDGAHREASVAVKVGPVEFEARAMLLATGVANVEPTIEDHDGAVAAGLLRYCPICDAHEVIEQRIAILSNSVHGVREAAFLRTYWPSQFCSRPTALVLRRLPTPAARRWE